MENLIKYIKNYINESLLDDEDTFLDPERDKGIIESWIKDNYTIKGRLKINDDLTVDCFGDVKVKNPNIESLTNGMFSWGEIGEDFSCYNCKNLISLEGAPEEVGRSFGCSYCGNLKSLVGAPEKVGLHFYCSVCVNLKSLKGAPEEVGGSFDCSECRNLTSLEGAPAEVKEFYCARCDKLTSLEGAPEKIKNILWCEGCKNLKLTDSDYKKYKIRS